MVLIKMMPAQYGDCFWISIDNKVNIMVDGGLKTTYTSWIKPFLIEKSEAGIFLDLIIVTHIDCDHIGGIIALLQDYSRNSTIEIKEIWHNGLFQIVKNEFLESVNEREKQDEDILNDIIQKGCLTGESKNIGVSESFALDVLVQENGIRRNGGKIFEAICDKTEDYVLDELIKIVMLGPDEEMLEEMDKYWQRELIAKNYRFQVTDKIKLMKAFEFQMSAVHNYYAPCNIQISSTETLEKYLSHLKEEDTSVTNNSSICFVLEDGKRKILFLGDAVIRDDGKLLKKIEERYGEYYHFTAIKLPHHGSRYNISLNFIKRYTADEYYFSTNSERFGHPDIDVIANIIYYAGDYDKKLIFNYPVDVIKQFDRSDWKEKYRYEIIAGNGNEVVERSYR